MNKADLLMATLRQTMAGKAGAKGGVAGALQSKDGKEKAEHFREQLRIAAKEPKPAAPRAAKPEIETAPATAKPVFDAAAVLADLVAEAKPDPELKDDRHDEDETSTAAAGEKSGSALTSGWRGPDAALSAVMSKLDRAPAAALPDDKPIQNVVGPQVDPKTDDSPFELTNNPRPTANSETEPAAQRFSLTVETTETKPAPPVKAAVREQETHFEPVQQATTLQKIVDRMASDLPAVAAPDSTRGSEALTQDANKTADARPVRMMTLELDPPNLGSVTVKMRLAGDSVEIHLTADRYETMQMLRQERGALTDAMQSAGYSFDIAAIDHSRSPDANLNNGQQPQQQAASDQRASSPSPGGPQADTGGSGRSSGDAQGGARHNRQDHEQSSKPQERAQNQGGGGNRSSTVYL